MTRPIWGNTSRLGAMLKLFLCLSLLLTPLISHAKLYKIIADDGNITYTDMPPSHQAKEHRLGRISSIGNPVFNMSKMQLSLSYTDVNGAMIVRGKVNGIAMRFIVDTGATIIAVPPKIAQKSGLMQGEATMVTAQTANGAVQVRKTRIKNIIVDRFKQSDVEATVQNISESEPDLGLLGMNFFANYNMSIQHDKHKIILEKR